MAKQMQIMMPLMTGFFAATYASGLAIYFLISNLVGILQYFLFRRHYATAAATAAAPAGTAGATKSTAVAKKPKKAPSKG
jgi:YidC/Oxa1 family membrane protein insertase